MKPGGSARLRSRSAARPLGVWGWSALTDTAEFLVSAKFSGNGATPNRLAWFGVGCFWSDRAVPLFILKLVLKKERNQALELSF